VDFAYNARAGPVQSKEITQRQGIPQRYLEQVMQHLVKAGVLKGVRGPRGGYHLARERRRITVGEVVRIVAWLESNGRGDGQETRSPLGAQVVQPILDELQDEVMSRLDAITIEDLCARAREAGVARETGTRLDFTI